MAIGHKNLSDWVRAAYPYDDTDPMTHLKLQKLAFYAWAGTLVMNRDATLNGVVFKAWKHGPVCFGIWEEYRDKGAATIPPLSNVQCWDPENEPFYKAIVRVYGRMSAWQIRQQSHLETPWQQTRQGAIIDREAVRSHFREVWQYGDIAPPRYLMDPGSFWVDGLPSASFQSMAELADLVNPTTGWQAPKFPW